MILWLPLRFHDDDESGLLSEQCKYDGVAVVHTQYTVIVLAVRFKGGKGKCDE